MCNFEIYFHTIQWIYPRRVSRASSHKIVLVSVDQQKAYIPGCDVSPHCLNGLLNHAHLASILSFELFYFSSHSALTKKYVDKGYLTFI